MRLFKSANEHPAGFISARHVIGLDGTVFMTRLNIGRLYLHIFHRGDDDADCHDHPFDFWTFPLTSYVEEVVVPTGWVTTLGTGGEGYPAGHQTRPNVVRAFRLHQRPATYTHRVLGRWAGPRYDDAWVIGKIVTLVWKSRRKRDWGFLKNRDGKWCWIPWKQYVFGGGKTTPCP